MKKSPNSRIYTDPSQCHFAPLARAGYAGRCAKEPPAIALGEF